MRGSGRARGRLKQGLVVAEVALSAAAARRDRPAAAQLLDARVRRRPASSRKASSRRRLSPGGEAYRERARVQDFYRDALERLREQPGVAAAGAISWTPLGSGGAATSFTISGREAPLPGQEPVADIRVVTPGLFETLRIPLLPRARLSGRTTAPGRRASRSSATRSRASSGPPAQALGQRLKLRWGGDPDVEIVGVVGDVHLASLDTKPRATVYLPHAQDGNNFMTLMLRTSGSPAALVPGVRATIAALDRALPVGSALPLERGRGRTRCARGASCWCWWRSSAARRWRSRGSGSSA